MSDTITRCPKCATSFRISEAHLKSAKGAVRCGSCLNIFNARENLVFRDDEEDEEPIEAPEEKIAVAKKPPAASAGNTPPPTSAASRKSTPTTQADTTSDEEDWLISDDMEADEDMEESDIAQPEKDDDGFLADFDSNIFSGGTTISGQEYNLFERGAQEEEEDEAPDTDESWAESLLKDDDEPTPHRHQRSRESEEDDDQSMAEFSESYSRSPFQMIDEEPDQDNGFNKPMYAHSDPAFDSIDTDIDEIDEDAYQPAEFESNRRYLRSIEPEPVEFSFKKSYPLWYSTKFWAALSILAFAVLLVQLAALNFDTLSRIEPYRGYYASVCPLVGCQLPPLVDRSRIRATNLVVRSHPNVKNALMVDAVLQNNASFPQTFPSLDLVFTDLQGEPLAARRFTPDQYLGGEVAGHKDIPIKQPVHISLEIVDPGPKAVSYFITIAD